MDEERFPRRFGSILSPRAGAVLERAEPPEFFHDLNLDQIVASVTAGWKEYDLAPFFQAGPRSLEEVLYRQEVFRDLDREPPMQAVRAFSAQMRKMRQYSGASSKGHYKYEKERWFLDAARIYCDAVSQFSTELNRLALASRGMRAFAAWLTAYAASGAFDELATKARSLGADLEGLDFGLIIDGDRVSVRPYESEPDYSVEVQATFAKFRREAAKDYRVGFSDLAGMNHIDAQIVDRVALLNPEPFRALDDFFARHADFLDPIIAAFDREVQFYVSYIDDMNRLRRSGLSFSFPQVSETANELSGTDCFDLALAQKRLAEKATVVCNGFFLRGAERVFVVSGPNQGGKTTFARMIGQMHYLAGIGCPVPGRETALFLYDRLFAHFERQEDIRNLRGKLHDDLVRVRRILDEATPRSLLIMNEIFSSTTLKDAMFLSRKIMKRVTDLDLLCVWVTFLEEMASFNEKTVSVVSTVDPKNPAARTYKLERRPADGLAYALAIAEKYRVTYEWLEKRVSA